MVDELAPSDSLNQTIQFINSTEQDEGQRINAQFRLASTHGVGLKPSEPTKGIVIAMVRSSGTDGPNSLLSMNSTETLRNFAKNDEGLSYTENAEGEGSALPYLNDKTATLVETVNTGDIDKQSWTAAISNAAAAINNIIFGDKPANYKAKPPVFKQRRARLPSGTMSHAKDGHTINGLYDSGAQVCVLSSRAAKAWGLLPFDDKRTATAANGGGMVCHGVANSVETFHYGARLVIDFLICDLEGEFDFLIGWDAIQHYSLYLCPRTGQLSGVDFDGNKFTTISQFQYTSIPNAVMAGESEEFTEKASAALKEGMHQQLTHLRTDEYKGQTEKLVTAAEDEYFEAVKTAHNALSESKSASVQAIMSGKWSDDRRFMEEVHPGHAVWKHDPHMQRARDRLLDARCNLVAATKLKSETDEHQLDSGDVFQLNSADHDDWLAQTAEIAQRFGSVITTAAVETFSWARDALNWPNAVAVTH